MTIARTEDIAGLVEQMRTLGVRRLRLTSDTVEIELAERPRSSHPLPPSSPTLTHEERERRAAEDYERILFRSSG